MTYLDAVNDFIRFCSSQLPVFKKYGSGWYGVNSCVKCGKHKKKVNMYITFPDALEPDRVIVVKCFRASCGHAGRLTGQDLINMGYKNSEAIRIIDEHKGSKSYVKLSRSGDTPQIVTHYTESNDMFKYFKDRTGVQLNFEKCKEYSIITDYKSLVKNNPFIPSACVPALKSILSKDNLVVMHTDKYKRVIIRAIQGGFKCILPLVEGNNVDYYVFRRPSNVKDIVVAEGVFDIINFANMNRALDSALFIGTLGLNATTDAVAYETLDYENLDRLIIVGDSEIDKYGRFNVNRDIYNGLIRKVGDRFKEIYLVYNSASKDFGDMREPIEVVMHKLK